MNKYYKLNLLKNFFYLFGLILIILGGYLYYVFLKHAVSVSTYSFNFFHYLLFFLFVIVFLLFASKKYLIALSLIPFKLLLSFEIISVLIILISVFVITAILFFIKFYYYKKDDVEIFVGETIFVSIGCSLMSIATLGLALIPLLFYYVGYVDKDFRNLLKIKKSDNYPYFLLPIIFSFIGSMSILQYFVGGGTCEACWIPDITPLLIFVGSFYLFMPILYILRVIFIKIFKQKKHFIFI